MATRKEDQVQRDHWYCIVDEVDSILVDEARTPLIISGPAPIEREQPFTRLKPGVDRLVNDQTRLCNRLSGEARRSSRSPTARTRSATRALRKLLQVKMGSPKNKLLLRLMENPEWRKLLDKLETEMNSDLNKDELYRLKEELFFVDRRAPAPGRPDRDRPRQAPARTIRTPSSCPTWRRNSPTWTRTPRFTPEQREAKKLAAQSGSATSPRRSTRSRSCCGPTPFTSATSNTS